MTARISAVRFEVRDREGAITNTRGAFAPQNFDSARRVVISSGRRFFALGIMGGLNQKLP
jgi:hypothetical protein